MPTIETSENKPRYGHSPILAISAARRSRMVTKLCAPRKMTRPRISTARPIGLLNWDYSTLLALGVYALAVPCASRWGRRLRRIAVAAVEITRGIDQRLTFLERDHVAAHRCGAAVAADRREHALHGLDRSALRVARDDDEVIAERLEPRHRQQRRLASLEHVDQLPAGDGFCDFGDLGFRGRRLDEQHVGAGLAIGGGAIDCRGKAFHRNSIRARDHD